MKTSFKPTEEFLEACRRVLGGDDPATVLTAMAAGGPLVAEVKAVHAEIVERKRKSSQPPTG
jgi:hypothetical protein